MSINITELLIKSLESACKDLVNNAVTQCANKYHFDANEAMRELGTDKIFVNAKKMVRGIAQKNKKAKKDAVPVPFIAEYVDQACCQALRFNHSLFTQCRDNKMNGSSYCKTCQMDADKNASGQPTCGTVDKRIELGDKFVDSKGRKPKNYGLVLKKLNIDIEDAKKYAQENHLNLFTNVLESGNCVPRTPANPKEQQEKVEKKRGRPKKIPTQVNATNDIFYQSTFEKVEPNPNQEPNNSMGFGERQFPEEESQSDNETTTSSTTPNKARNAKLSQQDKDAKKAQFIAMKTAEKEANKAIKATFKKGGAKPQKKEIEPELSNTEMYA